MISVSDILARVAVSQTATEGPNPALSPSIAQPAASVASAEFAAHGEYGEHGEYAERGELLSFITRFAAPAPLPVLREPPVEGKLTVEAQPTPPVHSSQDPVLPLQESEVMAWSIEDDAALYVLFDPAWNGMALPPNGELLPDDAAIVAALLDTRQAAARSEPARPLDSVAVQITELQNHNNEAAVPVPVPVPVPGQVFIPQEGEVVLRSDTVANMAGSLSPHLAAAAEADKGPSADRTLAASTSGVLPVTGPLTGTQTEPLAGTQIDAPQQIMTKIVGLSSSADSGGTGQGSRMVVPPPLTPAREPALAHSPASPATTEMDFLLRNEGHDRTWGRERWAEGLGRQLMIMTRDGLSSARLRLDPPSLGMLSIQIQMTEQGTSVSFVAQHPAVRDALEQQAARLQELFQDQELNLLDVSVSDQDARERREMNHVSASGQEASDEVDAEEQAPETQSHHLIDERV